MSTTATSLTGPAPEINRDRYGRPLVIPPDGGNPTPYTRATTIAGTLEDAHALTKWKQRQTAIGLADRPDLLTAVTAHRSDKQRLDDLCEQAMEASQSSAKATLGSAVHSLTEQLDRGDELPQVSGDVAADLAAYQQATEPLEVVAIEQFTVLDDYQIAGTADRIVEWPRGPGQRFIADLKTGSIKYGVQKIAAQLAIYARGQAYDIATGARAPLPDVHQTAGLIIHLPAGEGQCQLHWVNLARGWHGVELALQVRAWRKEKGLTQPFTP